MGEIVNRIHRTAIVDKGASLAKDVTVGAYAVVENDVTIGEGTRVAAHAIVKNGTVIGKNCFIDNFASIGGSPQGFGLDTGETLSGVIIGDTTTIREHAIIHRAVKGSEYTKIGNVCTIQAGAHIGHDCEVGDGTIVCSGALLGGWVSIGTRCFIGGGAAIHEYVVVGDGACVTGNSAIGLCIPPYTMVYNTAVVVGLNLKKIHVTDENVYGLKRCFCEFYRRTGFFPDRARNMLREGYGNTPESENFLKFFLMKFRRGFAPKRHKM
jgi:UDP-N-acetylglucosamine acyltransferase